MAEDQFYLTIGDDPKGRGKIAIITQGHPRRGDKNCVVCTMEIVPDKAAAEQWYDKMLIERPWETRN